MLDVRELNRIIVSNRELNLKSNGLEHNRKDLPSFQELLDSESLKISVLDLQFSDSSIATISSNNLILNNSDKERIIEGIDRAMKEGKKRPALLLDDQLLVVNSSERMVEDIHNNKQKLFVGDIDSLVIV
jgi:hypothetical protein